MRDAIAQLEGVAKSQGAEREPAIRVGGDQKVIWIDLGAADWKAVRVTAGGWEVVSGPDVAFVRGGTMLALPEPTRGGDVRNAARRVEPPARGLRARGWLAAPNAEPDWPLSAAQCLWRQPSVGKSTLSKMLLRTTDPNSAGLRRPSRKTEDILLAAKNGWTVGLDNMSWMTAELSDILCMICTGIATGTRAHYTNDEEHVYGVQRPILFNGVAGDLTRTQRPRQPDDQTATLADSRSAAPRSTSRRSSNGSGRAYSAPCSTAWRGGLQGRQAIVVEDPARLMDFERFAEAGCRAMGFEDWEFVEAYAANRHGSMVEAAEASAVGRAVVAFLNTKSGRRDGFSGQDVGPLSASSGRFKGNAGPT